MLQRMRDASIRQAVLNVVLGDLMAERLRERVPDAAVAVLHNWADGSAVSPMEHGSDSMRAKWGVGDRFVVGYSGNLGRAHHFETILAACARLRDRDDIAFVFVGDGPRRARVEAEAARLRLPNVRFLPLQPRERLGASLGAIDAHLVSLHPSLEGLVVPSKFYGIAAAGRPTVYVGNVEGEIPRLLRDGPCGIAVAPGDDEALSRAVAHLAAHRDEARLMGERARRKFEREFDLPVQAARWESLLSRVATRT
jgi:glycosyltransferase involved in cell wall biosynthesis